MNILWRIAKEKLDLRTFLQVFKDRLTKITCNAINITRWIYNSNERSGDSVIFFFFCFCSLGQFNFGLQDVTVMR